MEVIQYLGTIIVNDSDKENIGNIYYNVVKSNNNFNQNKNGINTSSPELRYNQKINEGNNLSYNDKNIYSYLYQLPFIKNRLIILDTEVSGISSLDHIIELCALEMIDGKLTSQYYHSFFNPKKWLNPSIIKRHRLPKNVFKYTYEGEKNLFKGFLNFVNNSIIIAHNAIFDMEKINYELNFYDLPLIEKHQFRCSMRIFFDKYKQLSNKFSKLRECCDFLGIKYIEENLHLAYYDAFLLGKIMEKIYENEYNNVNNGKNNLLINNSIENENLKNHEIKSLNSELKNIDYRFAKEAGNTENDSFEKLIDENIDNIYNDLEEQEITDIIFEKILKEEEKNNDFNQNIDENIDDIFNYLRNEEEKE